MTIFEHYSLKDYNTFGIDVKARYFVEITNRTDLHFIIEKLSGTPVPFLFLGGGSNVLFTRNFEGWVIKLAFKGIEVMRHTDLGPVVRVAAGESWHPFVMYCVNQNWAGLENLSLIPGCVGASPMQNIGAYGVEVKDRIVTVGATHIQTGVFREFSNAECEFNYRSSIFKTSEKGNWVIEWVDFQLLNTPEFNISYGAIRDELDAMNTLNSLSIRAISEAVIRIRSSKLPNPAEIGNAGSFFKNPVVSASQFEMLKSQYADIPFYPQPDGTVKLAAGWLIEKAGWKGYRNGDSGVHARQALVLVNYGSASGTAIYNLSEQIVDDIFRKFGVELEREVNIY